jgi:predicted permease
LPDWKPELRRRLHGAGLAPVREEEIVEELAQHLEERYGELAAGGVAEAEAQRTVLAELASAELLREELRRAERPAPTAPVLGGPWPRGFLSGLGGDVRHGLRALRKARGVTAVALLTLGLGIGANAAIFSVVDAVLLRPLPFADPEQLVAFWGSAPEMGLPVVNYPEGLVAYFRARSRTLDPIAAYTSTSLTVTGGGDPERLDVAAVTVDFLRLLGGTPVHGRDFLPEDGRRGAASVALLSHGLWQRRFGGDPAILGKSLVLEGQPTTVVGVLPKGLAFPAGGAPPELWVALTIDPQDLNCWCFPTLGRLKPGRTPEDAAREISDLTGDFWQERETTPPAKPRSRAIVHAEPLARQLVGDARTPVLVLLGAVGMVLLIACANVANLLLARASTRGQEIAVRCCLGASPWRIARQLLVESLLLALGGGLAGLVLAGWGVRALEPLVRERLPHLDHVGLDLRVLLVTLGVTIATGALFGLAPALRGMRVDLQQAVKEGARGTPAVGSRRLSHAFVVSQLALSLVLLVGAGLLLRSFRNLMEIDLGFRSEDVLVGRVSLPPESRSQLERRMQFYTQLAERVRELPGVGTVGLASIAPFSEGENGQIFTIRGREPAPGEPSLVARARVVTPGYFAAIGTPLRRGRVIDDTDTATAPPVAVVDETQARHFWPDGNAVGQEIRLGGAGTTNPWLRIVGVVAPVRDHEVIEDPTRHIYVPLTQTPAGQMDLVVRTAADAAGLTAAIRREVRALDPGVPFYEVHTLEDAVARRLTQGLLLGFAACALLLAAVGIYGVMALSVSQRVNEFGIRLAMGARAADILALVLGQGLRLVVLGLLIGLLGALGLGRFLSSMLFQVEPMDPLTLAGVAVVLVAAAFVACYLPARRATATDPLQALRHM